MKITQKLNGKNKEFSNIKAIQPATKFVIAAFIGRADADSIFGTEQNYELLEQKQVGNYMKFRLFHKKQKQSYKMIRL